MHLSTETLHEITSSTISHYDRNAEDFWEGTKDHDVSQNIEALVRHMAPGPSRSVLDLGCGPGRDLLEFKKRGYNPIGLDGSMEFCRMARARSGCTVMHRDFLKMELHSSSFHGIFANASLFHIPMQELPRILEELRCSLRDDGVLFCSNPRGPNQEGWSGERFGAYHSKKAWFQLMGAAGFVEVESYYRPKDQPRENQPWLASVWRRT